MIVNGIFLLSWTLVVGLLGYKAGKAVWLGRAQQRVERLYDDLDCAVDLMRNQSDLIKQLVLHIDEVESAWQSDRDRLAKRGL